MKALEWSHHFSHYKSMGIFLKNTPLQINLKHWKTKLFEIGVNSFIWQNIISDLIQETRGASWTL